MPDYLQGKIYKIVCNETGEIYIGSTTQSLRRRYKKHISDSKSDKRKCDSAKIIKNSKILLIENYPCKSRKELLKKEREWIDKIDCINKRRPIITKKERKKYQSGYRKENKDELNEYRRNWRKYKSSWSYNNYLGTRLNLLDIDIDLFKY